MYKTCISVGIMLLNVVWNKLLICKKVLLRYICSVLVLTPTNPLFVKWSAEIKWYVQLASLWINVDLNFKFIIKTFLKCFQRVDLEWFYMYVLFLLKFYLWRMGIRLWWIFILWMPCFWKNDCYKLLERKKNVNAHN